MSIKQNKVFFYKLSIYKHAYKIKFHKNCIDDSDSDLPCFY